MTEYKSIEEIEEKFTPEDIKKYPVVLRRRVDQYEADIINEWLRRMDQYEADIINEWLRRRR